MDLSQFTRTDTGELVTINGQDALGRPWSHHAFIPAPLPDAEPELTGATYRQVARAGRAIAALDATAAQLPNPAIFRTPTLRREAQATSALEGTYAPLETVLVADADAPQDRTLTEILNYVTMTQTGLTWASEGHPLTLTLLEDLQGQLMAGTPLARESGRLRDGQVIIGRREDAPAGASLIEASRFVPCPPGDQLRSGVRALLDWLRADHADTIDPVVKAAMAHYQFETLHPFRDGNGRLGRFLIVLALIRTGVLHEPTLSVSAWFEARRAAYYDALLAVSTRGEWDSFVRFLAHGLEASALSTTAQVRSLIRVQAQLHETVRSSSLRSSHALDLVDLALARPSLTVPQVQAALGLSYARANNLVSQLVSLGVLTRITPESQPRRFIAPAVLDVLLSS